jgi:hypothetical protein
VSRTVEVRLGSGEERYGFVDGQHDCRRRAMDVVRIVEAEVA